MGFYQIRILLPRLSGKGIVFLFLCAFWSCHKKAESSYKIFKYNQSVGISSLDPAFSKDLANMWACSHVYEGLFTTDSNTEISMLLVDSFWMSKDLKEYHFILKKNVWFHRSECFQNKDSTRMVCATDAVYSLKRLLDPSTASPGSWVLQGKLDSIHPFQIVDSSHFIIRLRTPMNSLTKILSMLYCSIIPKEAVEYYGKDFQKHPVGTGPFQFKLWEKDVALFFEKNRRYHQADASGVRLPYIDFIRVSFNEQKKTELFSFERGELSFVTGLDPTMSHEVFTQEGILRPKWKAIANVIKRPFLNTEYFAILMKPSSKESTHPLGNKWVRKAIQFAINKNELVHYVKSGLVYPATKGFVPPTIPEYDTSLKGYSYQPDSVSFYLGKAGFNPKNKPFIELHINNNFVELAEFLQHQLMQNGFVVEAKLHTADMMMQLATEGKLNFFRRSWVADYADAANFLTCFYGKNSTPPNYTRFRNRTYDELYEKLIVETSTTKKKIMCRQMEEILKEECPFLPLFYDQSIRLCQKNIQGLEPNALNTLDLRRVKIN